MFHLNERKIGLGTMTIIIVLTAVIVVGICYFAFTNTYNSKLGNLLKQDDFVTKLKQINQIIDKNYLNPNGEQEVDQEKMANYAYYGYVAGLGDKYSTYFSPDEFTEVLNDNAGSMTGIGVTVMKDSGSENIRIIEVYEDSPAQAAGLLINDLVVAVDGQSVEENGYDVSINKVLGEEGQAVTLTIERGGQAMDVTVTRQKLQVNPITYRMLSSNIGYIRIKSFNDNTFSNFESALTHLQEQSGSQGLNGIVFDLRNNTGGTLDSIVAVLDKLLPEGEIVKLVNRNGVEQVYKSDANQIDLPLVVLVNDYTASAAELFTGALMDYDKAEVVGTKTYGKGCALGIYPLKDGSGLSIVDRMYYTPAGRNFEGNGIDPDYVVEIGDDLRANLFNLTQKEDPQLSKAIEVLSEVQEPAA